MFSSSRPSFVVPGIGTIQGFCASSQARAIWAGVAFFRPAIAPSRSINASFAFRASGVNRGRVLRKSVLSNVVVSSIFPVRKPLPERAVRDEPHAELFERRQHFRFRASRPERVLALDRRDRQDGMRAANRLRTRFRKAEVLHLALLNQILHRSSDVLDGNVRVDPVLIEQVDRLDLQALERGLGDLLDVLGPAVQADPLRPSVRIELEPELRRDRHSPAEGREGFTESCSLEGK